MQKIKKERKKDTEEKKSNWDCAKNMYIWI